MRKTWTESDAQQLKDLREQAGIAQAAFAKRYALSVAQVRELEGGKTGSYYSEDIKAHTGRRLLAALGYVAPPPSEPEPAPTPPPASPSAPQAEVEAAPVAEPAAAPEPESQPEPEAMAAPVIPSEPQPAAVTEAPAPPAASESTPPTPPAKRRSTGPWLLIASVAVIAVAVLLVTRTPGTVTVSTVTVPVNAAPADASAQAAASDASAPAAAASAASAASVVIAGADKPALPAGCEAPGPREATQYQSPVADKPATYVHVEAMQGARVCVLDSQNQVRALVLKVGESVNVAGVPPFTIRSAQWNDLKVFFQGLRVQVEPGAASDNIVILPKRGG
jgi:transcriptional regulator with XRE-family HTH domain